MNNVNGTEQIATSCAVITEKGSTMEMSCLYLSVPYVSSPKVLNKFTISG